MHSQNRRSTRPCASRSLFRAQGVGFKISGFRLGIQDLGFGFSADKKSAPHPFSRSCTRPGEEAWSSWFSMSSAAKSAVWVVGCAVMSRCVVYPRETTSQPQRGKRDAQMGRCTVE